MKSNKRICELLVQTGAYKDLDQPTILASGELGIYFINAEKLCMDGGEFEKYGDDSEAMSQHMFRMMKEHPEFDEIIDILAKKAEACLKEGIGLYEAISGGQRRDWIFSCPIAEKLNIPHISLYKDGRAEMLIASERAADKIVNMRNYNIVHAVDMITAASSIYRVEDDIAKGWVPMLRKLSKNPDDSVNHILAVVTRNQGGEAALAKQGITVHPFVSIDEEFLLKYSKRPEVAVIYKKDPTLWSQNYLMNGDLDPLVKFFDPKHDKPEKARNFMKMYARFMNEAGVLDKLDAKVQAAYGARTDEIVRIE